MPNAANLCRRRSPFFRNIFRNVPSVPVPAIPGCWILTSRNTCRRIPTSFVFSGKCTFIPSGVGMKGWLARHSGRRLLICKVSRRIRRCSGRCCNISRTERSGAAADQCCFLRICHGANRFIAARRWMILSVRGDRNPLILHKILLIRLKTGLLYCLKDIIMLSEKSRME